MEHHITSHRYYIGLLGGLLAVFLISPFFTAGDANPIFGATLVFTLLFCVLAISPSKKLVVVALVLAAPLVASIVTDFLGLEFAVNALVSAACGVALIALIISVMLRDMFLSTKVDAALIVGAVSLYLLLGLMWGFIYLAIEYLYPNSFRYNFTQALDVADPTATLMYYSMVTLTTLGYGDIAPLSAPARAMATMQAVAGQIYLTVLVARLVGMHIAQRDTK